MLHLGLSLLVGSTASLGLALLLVRTRQHHGHFSMDAPVGVQKVHQQPVPRIGGIGIYFALWAATAILDDPAARKLLGIVLVAGLPALLGGLLEDVTRRVGVRARLVATFAAGLAACVLSGSAIGRVDVAAMDHLLAIAPLAVLFTAFCIAGVANAINIIDGFHGLAGGTVVIALAAIGTMAAIAGDASLATACALVGACAAGFLLINFPWGKLFLGDGGAYFLGFSLAWLAVLLPARNPDVSPWASLLACSYPVIEVLYSVARRMRHRRCTASPDRAHLHSLIAANVVAPRTRDWNPEIRNACVSLVMWACATVPCVLAVLLQRNTMALATVAACCVLLYHSIYRRVLRARHPAALR